MRKHLRKIAIPCMMALACLAADALDLPVKSINGRKYYFYEVKSGDNIFSIARELGISRDDIIRYNPAANDRLRTGTTLYFPFEELAPQGTGSINHEVQRNETLFGLAHRYGTTPDEIVALNPELRNRGLRHGETIVIPTGAEGDYSSQPASSPNETPLFIPEPQPEVKAEPQPQPAPEAKTGDKAETADTAAQPAPEEEEGIYVGTVDFEAEPADSIASTETSREASIAVVLPFELATDNPGKHAQLYTDFYKGMLIGAEEMSRSGAPVSILCYDSSSDFAIDDRLREASVIIAPEDSARMADLTAAVAEKDGYVLNIFNLRDRSYATTPSLVQTNIPHQDMYAKAYRGMRELYGDTRPVLLRNTTGRNEKQAFIDYIREQYIADGIAPVEISYSGNLRSTDLDILDAAGTYVIVPSSGTLSEFSRMSHALKAYMEDGSTASVSLFGYPDWTAFRNEAREMLHTLGASIYSRVYLDPESMSAKRFADAFEAAYGNAPMEVVPNQGALGYDVAVMLIENLRANGGTFTPDDTTTWRGIQSAFRLEEAGEDGGRVNNALYIITFGRDKTTDTRIL